jgi:hypothetical protein
MLPAIALISLLLLPLQTAAEPLHGWKDFSPKGGGFQVKMPGVPEQNTRTVKTPKGPVKITQYGIEHDGVAFLVFRSGLPPDAVTGDARKVLDEARDAGVRNSRGTLKEEKEIQLDGHPGRDMLLDLPESRMRGGGIYRARVYLVGRTHYQVATLSSKAREVWGDEGLSRLVSVQEQRRRAPRG